VRIQLIHPPVYLNVHAMTALRPSMPLGLAYIGAVLEQGGHDVSVIDAVAEAPDRVTQDGTLHRLGLGPEEIVARVLPETQVLCVTNMWSFSWPLVRRILVALKQAWPDKLIVCGGEHFTGLPELSMKDAPIDYIVLGEGEETVAELMKMIARGERDPGTMAGVAFRRDGAIVMNERRARVRAVDELPWPAWHLFDLKAYNDHNLVNGVNAGWTIPILATRGCPYQCTYCSSNTMWTTKWYPRDPIDVADEITQYAKTYGAKNFPFQDLTAIIKKDWIVAFCNELIRRKLDVTWQFPSGTRCEVVDDEVASLLARSGGRHLAFAPESGSEHTRKLIKKMMTTQGLLNAVHASVKHGLNLTCFFVIGFPHDTKADLKETARMVRKLARVGVDDIAIGFYFPIPNTALYRYLVEQGRSRLQRRVPDDADLRQRREAARREQLLRAPDRAPTDVDEVLAAAELLSRQLPVPPDARVLADRERDPRQGNAQARDLADRTQAQGRLVAEEQVRSHEGRAFERRRRGEKARTSRVREVLKPRRGAPVAKQVEPPVSGSARQRERERRRQAFRLVDAAERLFGVDAIHECGATQLGIGSGGVERDRRECRGVAEESRAIAGVCLIDESVRGELGARRLRQHRVERRHDRRDGDPRWSRGFAGGDVFRDVGVIPRDALAAHAEADREANQRGRAERGDDRTAPARARTDGDGRRDVRPGRARPSFDLAIQCVEAFDRRSRKLVPRAAQWSHGLVAVDVVAFVRVHGSSFASASATLLARLGPNN
jgi:anaerobic magnesium-protoporphyrin IX monomethyl ester cyclase